MAKFAGNDIKKRKELFQLNRFKDVFSEISNSEVSVLENDPPDGLIQVGGKIISIELTQILWDEDKDGMNKKAQESIADMIMDFAEEKYRKLRGLPYVQVNVSFTDKYGVSKNGEILNLNSGDKRGLSDYIVQKVIEYMPSSEKELFEVPEYNENRQRLLHPKIESIYITRYPMLTENYWSATGGGAIPAITIEKIQERITIKNKKLIEYKESYDECWLLIIEDAKGISGYFDFRNIDELSTNKFKSDFNRIFIFRNGKLEVLELQLLNRITEP